MKESIIAILMLAAIPSMAGAQDVYKEILRISKEAANDQSKDIETRKVATFKVDELNYMAMKSREQMPDSSMQMLDNQAYAMYTFVNQYVKALGIYSKKKQRETIRQIYKDATIHNARFGDMDADLVESYYRRSDYLTQFSLDTDWVKALEEVRRVMANTELE